MWIFVHLSCLSSDRYLAKETYQKQGSTQKEQHEDAHADCSHVTGKNEILSQLPATGVDALHRFAI